MKERIEEIKKHVIDFHNRKILVIGDVMLDRYYYGTKTRPSPEASGINILDVEKKQVSLGGAANVANNISQFGAKVILYGLIGNDDSGVIISGYCKKSKIEFIPFYDNRETIVKTRLILNDKQLIRFDEEKKDPISEKLQDQILLELDNKIQEVDCLIFSDYAKGLLSKRFCQRAIKIAKKNNKMVLVDPKPQNIDYFVGCTLICPNRHEAEKMTQIHFNGKDNLIKTGKKLMEKLNSDYILITCGEFGMFSYDKEGHFDFVPTYARKVNDIVGAGDTVLATIALALSSNMNIHDAAKLANYAAGVVVGKVGTNTVTQEELIQYIKEHNLNE